jgi:hypothetical protein
VIVNRQCASPVSGVTARPGRLLLGFHGQVQLVGFVVDGDRRVVSAVAEEHRSDRGAVVGAAGVQV